jgi:preprotein translocase subunit SecE
VSNKNGFSSVGRALVSKTRCREFEPLNPCKKEKLNMISYIKESFEELKNNVSWTERSELQRLVVIVLVFSILFSLAIWGADTVLSRVIQFYFNLIG